MSDANANSTSHSSRRRATTVGIAIACAAVVIAVAAAAVAALRGEESVTITGTLTLNSSRALDQNILGIPGECRGHGAYGDIVEGAPVTIRDASGKVIATTQLRPGKPSEQGPVPRQCAFPFTARDVPGGDFYGIEVAHRGAVSYSRRQVRNAQLQLGD